MINKWKWIGRLKKAIIFRVTNYILVGLMGMFIAFFFSDLTDKFLNGNYQHIELIFFQIVAVLLITCFVIPVLQYKEANLMEKQGGEADVAFFREFLDQKNYSISEKDYGMYMNILWGDFPTYRMNLIFIVSYFTAGTITVLASVGIIACYHIGFALMAIVISITVLLLPLLFQKKLERRNDEKLSQKDVVVENMKNIFANVEYIRLEKQKSMVRSILRPVQDRYAGAIISYEKLKSVLTYLVNAVLLCIEILVYGAGCYMISLGNINIAVFVKVVLMISVTKNGVSWLMEGVQSIHDIKNSQKRIETVLLKNEEAKGEALSSLHKIILKNVCFEYEGSNTRIEYPDLVLEEKNVYHLVGINGAGKSTLLKILAKYYYNYEGSILVNGEQKLKDIDERSWYGFLAFIPQKPLLFHMSVRDNILLGNREADRDLYEKLLDDFRIKELEDKTVGFGGEGISGGEAQSISLVRALLRKPQMILADEPYNTLDVSRKEMLNKYIDMMDSTTFIIVSHQVFLTEREIHTVEVCVE
ncbi:ABC transporter ATP-binding protein/permease [Acetatifactor muris]|uniref:Multidrug resistance ABC transporter ATP-binding/permease protein BmrA n=1 Tax=Acetatifactor muris TaxID=879566 RepID=A0A2K4ZD04_9FIRM|nr:ABC transporter ATP-binding protein [Acetatifactor muris]MCR2046752.1 ABC transporter ATP-binding protein/permease [Acetatifactor muris]SOY28345.1 Multidrug resistance ABC transporter ATP-binding/permease protein BmrA [Acetatifactor muris]